MMHCTCHQLPVLNGSQPRRSRLVSTVKGTTLMRVASLRMTNIRAQSRSFKIFARTPDPSRYASSAFRRLLPGGIGRHSGAPWHVRKTAGAWRDSGSWCNQIVDLPATAYWRAITSPSPQAGQRRFDFEAPHMRQQLRQLLQAQIVVHAAYVRAADVFQRRVGCRLQLL